MTTSKVKTIGNEFFGTPDLVKEFRSMQEAKSYSLLRKQETGRDYRITVGGISYYRTDEGDDIGNLTSL